MRIWTLHPSHLDPKSLVVLWRDGLLAQSALRGDEGAYRKHPQLARFRALKDPVAGMARYLKKVADEADERGYVFDRRAIVDTLPTDELIRVTDGQVEHEWQLLMARLAVATPRWAAKQAERGTSVHDLIQVVPGHVDAWELS